MVMNDTLASALSNIMNCEKVSKDIAVVKPVSNMMKKVLEIMNAKGYIGSFTEVKDDKGNILKVNLLGNLNDCGVIKPNFSVKKDSYEKFEKRYLPARNMGFMFVSTPQGIMTHEDAKKKGIGGKLIAYCY